MIVWPAPRSPLDGDSMIDVAAGVGRMSICGPALGQAGQRQVGGVARPVMDRRAVEVDRRGGERGGVLPGRHRVAEGQRSGARAARIGRHAAVVQRQRRHAARNRHRLAEAERQRDRLTGAKVAARGRLADRAKRRT